MTIHDYGTDFQPANPIELLDIYLNVSTLLDCFRQCHMNIQCRTFVIDLGLASTCRLYEGMIDTGTIINSSSTQSRVGNIHYHPTYYTAYQQACNLQTSMFDRYLICVNGTWTCASHLYWNGSMCLNDVYINATCNSNDACRKDVGLQCDSRSKKCECNGTSMWNGIFCGELITNESGNASTSLSWDCCKPSCSWSKKASVTNPVNTCAQDGITIVDKSIQSVCAGSSAFSCINHTPWRVNETLSYGYGAASLVNKNESHWCCSCYSLIFTSGPVIGKQMIIQVINSGFSSSDNFGLLVPSTGWIHTTNYCAKQFNGSFTWGSQYNGVSNRSDCANLPSVFQAGCYWRFDWFMDAQYPTVEYQKVTCPIILTAKTGCIRL